MRIVFFITMIAAVVGFVLSVLFLIVPLFGIDFGGPLMFGGLFVGCFILGFPAIGAVQKISRRYRNSEDFWKRWVFPACPKWMKFTFYALMGYALASISFCSLWLVGMWIFGTTQDSLLFGTGMPFKAVFLVLYFSWFMLLYYRIIAR